MPLKRPVAEGQMLSWDDVEATGSQAVTIRRTMEDRARTQRAAAA